MSWVSIPNEVVKGCTGSPMKAQRFNSDLELLYREFKCPVEGCTTVWTTLEGWQEHVAEEHPGADMDKVNVALVSDKADATVGLLVSGLIRLFHTAQQGSVLRAVQKANDAYHAAEVWRRVESAQEQQRDIRVKAEQHDWLKSVLVRQVPLTSQDKEAGKGAEDRQTLAMHLYGLDEDAVRQAVLPLADRRIEDESEQD